MQQSIFQLLDRKLGRKEQQQQIEMRIYKKKTII